MPYSVEEVRARMLSAWEGVKSLYARAHDKAYITSRPDPSHNSPRFLACEDIERILPYHYEAWWQEPDHWRHDHEMPSPPYTKPYILLSYLVTGDSWRVKKDGRVIQQGTVTESQRGLRAQGENLVSGRPYLSASDNRFLWAWLNPQLWAASLSLVVLDGSDADDVFHDDKVVHVVAGSWATGRASLADQKNGHWSIGTVNLKCWTILICTNYGWICVPDFAGVLQRRARTVVLGTFFSTRW